ncbi:MAG TPA: TIR domain-containing protein, partial [Acidimicrobiia bacterium]|nr:TIR domain-containing protein [Acidimicrobiia bacterium]
MGYDAFISYSHAGDGQLAPAVQSGLQRMARPWYRRRALHVFRDETGLSVNPDLWQAIRAALDDSEWFVLFASPEAAQSEWVNLEVETWLDAKPVERVLPVITGGTVEWDAARNDFTPDSDAVPPALRGMYADQPRWLDLRWARTADDLDLRNAGFRLAIAGLAAPMHGMPKDEFEGEDIRLHRRAMRFARLGIATLVVFAVAAIAASVLAFGYAQRANASADRERRSAAAARAARADADALAANERDAQDAATAAAENANAQQDRAETEAQKAKQAQDEAEAAQADAEAEADNARQAQATADASAQDAKQQAARADRQATVAQTQGSRADAEAQRANDAATAAQQNADEARANAAEASANAQTAAENAAEAKRIADDLATANTSLAATNDQLVDERNLSGRQRVAAVANRLFAEAGAAAANHDDAISSLLAVQGQAFAARTAAAGGGGKSALGRAGDTPAEGLVSEDAITTGLATALTDNPALLQVP